MLAAMDPIAIMLNVVIMAEPLHLHAHSSVGLMCEGKSQAYRVFEDLQSRRTAQICDHAPVDMTCLHSSLKPGCIGACLPLEVEWN